LKPIQRLLFVCGQNKLRSPTAERLFSNRGGLIVASAGIDREADVPVTPDLVAASDLIFVMEKSHEDRLKRRFKKYLSGVKVVCLNIPDQYDFMDPALIKILLQANLSASGRSGGKSLRAGGRHSPPASQKPRFGGLLTFTRRTFKMKRKDWLFDHVASKLAEAANAKHQHHQERFEWWKNRREQVMAQIREEGLEIDESIALEYSHPKRRDWEQGAQVTVRDDLRKDLNECLKKLAHHTELVNDYQGWHQVLSANPEARFSLDYQDWLFFFGRGDVVPSNDLHR